MKERLEGKQSVLAALKARRRKIEVILISWNAHLENTEAVIKSAEEQGIPVKKVSAEEITSAAKGKTHGGVIAICTPKPLSTNEELFLLSKQRTITPFFVLLEGIEDEQNLGFIIRSAGVMGVNAILLKKHIWAFDPLTLSRVSAGVYEQMPMVKIEKASDILPQLQKMGLKIYGAIAGAKKTMYDVDFTKPTIIALGGEKRGLSGAVRGACDGFFSIPMPARTSRRDAGAGGPARTIVRLLERSELQPTIPGSPSAVSDTCPNGRSVGREGALQPRIPSSNSLTFKLPGNDTGVSSLSLSHSAAIIMAEVMRQRFLLTK